MKRKVILYISQSLDGYIADEHGSVGWIAGNDLSYQGDYGYEDFIESVDTIIMGVNTYRQITTELSPHEWPYAGRTTYVLTTHSTEDSETIKFTDEPLPELLKSVPGRNIWICGGASLVEQCLKEDLIDEYRITTVPVLLGKGIRLFRETDRSIRLFIKEVTEKNGLITAVYRNIED